MPSEKSVYIQGSCSTESVTDTSEPPSTAPTATLPESADTEQILEPEIATSENTTAAQTEPRTTKESESN